MRLRLSVCLALACTASGVRAHEFWIEPEAARLDAGGEVVADLKVGQMMEGRSYPFLSHKIVSYTVTDRSGTRSIEGDEGDIPSLTYQADEDGLQILAYHAVAERVTFDEFQTFSEYLEEEGHSAALARHEARGLPEAGFTETYTRNAKALVQVGPADPDDKDEAVGLPFELVALDNPYALDEPRISVQLLSQSDPAADVQVAIFQRTGPETVTRRTVRTGADGVAEIDLTGGGRFLLSALHLEETPPETGAVWHSTWASLVFELPIAGNTGGE